MFPNERRARSIWFTDEKTFTVATPVNSQSDRVYSDVRKKSKFQQQDSYANVDISVAASWFRQSKTPRSLVSVGVSRMGKTNVVFVGPEVKVNSKYYCDHVLERGLLPEQDVIVTIGRCSRTELLHTQQEALNFHHQENLHRIRHVASK